MPILQIALIFISLALFSSCTSVPPLESTLVSNPIEARLKSNACEIAQDSAGIWHAKSEDMVGLAACLGYLHGKERGFQIDYLRRTTYGRLSEILGTATLKSDFFMRLMGLSERARPLFKALPESAKEVLWAYSYGVNAGFRANEKKPLYEFEKYGYQPEPWQPEDSVSILLLQSFAETQATFRHDLREHQRAEKIGPQVQNLTNSDGLPWDISVLKPGEYEKGSTKNTGQTETDPNSIRFDFSEFLPDLLREFEGRGSNNWVLSGLRSQTKTAWLANDPHLSLQHPSFWHWVNLEARDINVVGASVPGIPIIPSGANQHMSWGLTDSYMDVADLISVPEAEVDALPSIRPKIMVKVGFAKLPFMLKSFRRTKEGWPVLPIDSPKGRAIVLKWAGFDVTANGFASLIDVVKAKSVSEMDQILSQIDLPTWNFVFADSRGNIGYRVNGLIPKRESPRPFGLEMGSLSTVKPFTYLSKDEVPHLKNPKRGFLVTGNNRQFPSDSRFNGGRAYPQSFRAGRIEELLLAEKNHSLESQRKIQCDTRANDAVYLVPPLLELLKSKVAKTPDEMMNKMISILSPWDFQTGKTCEACSLYYRWLDRSAESIEIPLVAIYRVLKEPEKFPDYVAKLIAEIPKTFDDVTDRKTGKIRPWGEFHYAHFDHLAGEDQFISQETLSTEGSAYTVNPGHSEWRKDHYAHTQGASQRLLVEVTSPPKVYFTLAGSNSDTFEKPLNAPNSPWLKWRNCELTPVEFPFRWKDAKVSRLRLELPAKP